MQQRPACDSFTEGSRNAWDLRAQQHHNREQERGEINEDNAPELNGRNQDHCQNGSSNLSDGFAELNHAASSPEMSLRHQQGSGSSISRPLEILKNDLTATIM